MSIFCSLFEIMFNIIYSHLDYNSMIIILWEQFSFSSSINFSFPFLRQNFFLFKENFLPWKRRREKFSPCVMCKNMKIWKMLEINVNFAHLFLPFWISYHRHQVVCVILAHSTRKCMNEISSWHLWCNSQYV